MVARRLKKVNGSKVGKKSRHDSLEGKSIVVGHDLMNQLTYDLVEKILGFLSLPRDRCSAAAVSKNWLHMLANMRVVDCRNTSNSKYLTVRKVNDVKLAKLAIRAHYRGSLTELLVNGAESPSWISDYGLEIIAKASPRLKILTLWNCTWIGNEGFKSVGQWCKGLECLNITNCPLLTDEGLTSVGDNCLSLSTLDLQSCQFIGSRSLVVFAEKCLKLESISLSECSRVEDSGIIAIVSFLPKLKTLKLAIMRIGDSALEAIRIHGKILESLHLKKIKGPTAEGYSSIIAKEDGLRSLMLRYCTGFSHDSFKVLVAKKFSGLSHLELKGCDSVSDKVLIELSESTQSMRIISLSKCNGFTYVGLLKALESWRKTLKDLSLKKCYIIRSTEGIGSKYSDLQVGSYPSLDTLFLRQCGGVEDLLLYYISLSCDQVCSVSIEGADSVTDQGILSLFSYLDIPDKLSSLNLRGFSMLREVTIYFIVTAVGRGLRYLYLEGCGGLNDWTVATIAVHCTELEYLNVNKCSITDVGVFWLMNTEHHNLQNLLMSGCTEITDRSLQLMEKTEPGELMFVDISECPKLSSQAIDHLQMTLPECDVLHS